MIRPSLLPDEFAPGYLGRVYRFNGWPGHVGVGGSLLSHGVQIPKSRGSAAWIRFAASVAGIDVEKFVQLHTLLPIRKAVVVGPVAEPHGGASQPTSYFEYAFSGLRQGAYFCQHCVEEDLGFHGFSYWRLDHQLPGLYWCQKHDRILQVVEDKNAYEMPPSHFAGMPKVADPNWTGRIQSSEHVQRFLMICAAYMDRTHPLSAKLIGSMMCRRICELGFHNGRGWTIRGPFLSDAILNSFDRRWLIDVSPSLKHKRMGDHWLGIDDLTSSCIRGPSALECAVMLSVLFESADDVLYALETETVLDFLRSERALLAAAHLEEIRGVARKRLDAEIFLGVSEFLCNGSNFS